MKLAAERLHLQAGRTVLCRELSFACASGEIWGVLGRNGAGKTTLLRTLAGLSAPGAGRVVLDGVDIASLGARELARRRAFVPQRTRDAFAATVRDSVATGRYPHTGAGLAAWRAAPPGEDDKLRAALRLCDLEGLAERNVLTLSGGERQRVALASALAQDVALLILDEPLAHLDFDRAVRTIDLLRGFVAADAERLVVVSLHDLNFAVRLVDHVLLFSGDGLVQAGPAATLLKGDVLSDAFGHPLREIRAEGTLWFAPR